MIFIIKDHKGKLYNIYFCVEDAFEELRSNNHLRLGSKVLKYNKDSLMIPLGTKDGWSTGLMINPTREGPMLPNSWDVIRKSFTSVGYSSTLRMNRGSRNMHPDLLDPPDIRFK